MAKNKVLRENVSDREISNKKISKEVKLSIIIPAYNEEQRLKEERTIENYAEFFSKIYKDDFEIIVVLNGCKDNTLEVVQEAAKKFKQVRFLDIKEAIGKGGAIIEGFKLASGKLIGFVDADMSTKPDAFYDLILKINGFDGIIASRRLKDSIVNPPRTFSRDFSSICFNLLVRLLFGLNFKDTQCVDGSTQIYGVLDGYPIRTEIKNLSTLLKKTLRKEGKNFFIYDIKDQFSVPALNFENKLELTPVSSIVLRTDEKNLYEIKLKGGRSIKISEDHPILTYFDNQFVYKQGKKLNIGDKVVVLKKFEHTCFPEFGNSINIIDCLINRFPNNQKNFIIHGWKKYSYVKSAKQLSTLLNIKYNHANAFFRMDIISLNYLSLLKLKSANNLRITYYRGKLSIPVIIPLSILLMRLLGYYASEGCIDCDDKNGVNRHTLRFSFNQNEMHLVEEIKMLFKTIFGVTKFYTYTTQGSITIGVMSRMICLFFKDILETGVGCNTKKIPSIVYAQDNQKIGHFLETYFLGDGNFSKHKLANSLQIRADSCNENLIKDIQFILLKMGVTSNVHSTDRKDECINGRKLNGKLKWNICIHLGRNTLKLLKYLPTICAENEELISKMKGKLPSLFEREDNNINDFMGATEVVEINKTKKINEWYDLKIQSHQKPYMNFMHDCGIISHNCGAKLFNRKACKAVLEDIIIKKWAFDVDLLYSLKGKGFKTIEVPTIWSEKEGSKLKWNTFYEMFLGLVKLRFLK